MPGHHFQITLEMENPNLNTFRRLGSRMVGGAFVEGWGLYSERLADEMGLFRNEAERFGMLDAQAWRAARLVVDTGMHALRWTRQQSIDYLLAAGLSLTDATIETDRYIAWPAQALTYKLGQRAIEQLRRQLTARDGSRFDLREFHDQVLGHGSLPLATLERELPGLGRRRRPERRAGCSGAPEAATGQTATVRRRTVASRRILSVTGSRSFGIRRRGAIASRISC